MSRLTYRHNSADYQRYRHVRLAHRLRGPLAMVSLAAGFMGLFLNLANHRLTTGNEGHSLGTHPATALLLVLLCSCLLGYRPGQSVRHWRYALATLGLCVAVLNLVWPDLFYDAFIGIAATADSRMGQDTSIMLALLFSAVLFRRHHARIGQVFATLALTFLLFSFMGHSFGRHYLDGQMAVTTLVALVPATFAVLSLYAHFPLYRLALMSDANGVRTRMIALIGFLIPWGSGLLLFHAFGVPERNAEVESVMLSFITFSMVAGATYVAFLHEGADQERRRAERQLSFIAVHDRLTGTLNRAGLGDVMDHHWQRFRSDGRSVAVILLDLDHFKKINDTYGHAAGDIVLSTVRRLLSPHLRTGDVIGRWGGEEFVVLLDGPAEQDVEGICERLRAAIEAMPEVLGREGGQSVLPPRVTASFGVSCLRTGDESFDAALKRADAALYRAKENGRNRVVFASQADAKTAA